MLYLDLSVCSNLIGIGGVEFINNGIYCIETLEVDTLRTIALGAEHFLGCEESAIENSVFIVVKIVAGTEETEALFATGERFGCAVPWTAHEIVVLDVSPRVAFRVAHDIGSTVAPVVDDIVDILVKAFDFGVTGLVLNIEVAVECDATVSLDETSA